MADGSDDAPDVTAEAVQSLTAPAIDDACDLVASAIDRGALVTLFGRCTVEYEGRAASELGPGDRLLVLKPDGVVLVHTEEDQQPV